MILLLFPDVIDLSLLFFVFLWSCWILMNSSPLSSNFLSLNLRRKVVASSSSVTCSIFYIPSSSLHLSSLKRIQKSFLVTLEYYYNSFTVFHINISGWSFTGVWETASLLMSPGLFSVFWPFSIMLLFWWSPHVRQLPSLPVPLIVF